MKVLQFKRKAQYSEEIENHIGLYSSKMANYNGLVIINQINTEDYENPTLLRGVCFTNAFDIQEIEFDKVVFDAANGEPLKC